MTFRSEMNIFRRDQIKPINRVDITGFHPLDRNVRTLREFGWKKIRLNGRVYLEKVLN